MDASKQQTKLNCRLLLLPAPFQGHQNPMLHLATLLHSKGFSITIIQTPYKPINPTQFPNFSFHFLINKLLESYTESPSDVMKIISSMNNSCSEPFRDCLAQILSEHGFGPRPEPGPEPERIGALIADPLCTFARAVADSFNIPRITLRTGSLSSLVVYSSLSYLREKGYFNIQGPKLDEPIPELPPLKIKDIPPQLYYKQLETYVQEIKTSQGVICNTFEELENSSIIRLQQTINIPIFAIGPLHKYSPTSTFSTSIHDQNTISWLSTQAPNSVLYVSFGSVALMNKDEFWELAWGLQESRVPFLWVVRQDLVTHMQINDTLFKGYLETVGERGHVTQWTPQLEVLAHLAIGGFWTHNGWNSTIESVCEGVPMLCQPLIFDQGMNARYVSDGWRVGLMVKPGAKREEISRVIRKLMLEEEGEEIRNRAKVLKEKAIVCINKRGSSYNSLEKLCTYLLSF